MKCDNKMRVYEKNHICTHPNKIEIDWHGLCKNIIPIRITQENLELDKLYTKTVYEHDDKYYFDKEAGRITFKEKFLGRYDLDVFL